MYRYSYYLYWDSYICIDSSIICNEIRLSVSRFVLSVSIVLLSVSIFVLSVSIVLLSVSIFDYLYRDSYYLYRYSNYLYRDSYYVYRDSYLAIGVGLACRNDAKVHRMTLVASEQATQRFPLLRYSMVSEWCQSYTEAWNINKRLGCITRYLLKEHFIDEFSFYFWEC